MPKTQDDREQADYNEMDDPIVGRRTRELLGTEPGHHPPPDQKNIDPSSFLGQMFARANSGLVIPKDPAAADEVAFFNRLREQDELPSPSDTYCARPSIAEMRKSVRERLHPLVEGPVETMRFPSTRSWMTILSVARPRIQTIKPSWWPPSPPLD